MAAGWGGGDSRNVYSIDIRAEEKEKKKKKCAAVVAPLTRRPLN